MEWIQGFCPLETRITLQKNGVFPSPSFKSSRMVAAKISDRAEHRQSVLHVVCYTAWIRKNPSTIHGFCPAKQIVLVQLLRSTFHSTLAIYTGTTVDRHGNKAPGKCSATPLSSRNLDKQTFPQGNYQREQPHSRKQEKSPIPIAFRCSSNACPIMLLYPAAALPLPRHVKHQ